MSYDFVIHRISNIVCIQFNTLFLGPAKRGRQSSIYNLTSMDYSLGWRGGGGGVKSHGLEPLCSFVEIIFSLLLILMRVFSKYLILIHRL